MKLFIFSNSSLELPYDLARLLPICTPIKLIAVRFLAAFGMTTTTESELFQELGAPKTLFTSFSNGEKREFKKKC